MNALKAFCAAATAAIVVAGLSPAFAQTRDTRPLPERPPVESSQHDDDTEPQDKPRLPKSSAGVDCLVDGKNSAWVVVTNDTGATIPAGSTVTIYVQPGNIQKLYKLNKPLKAGAQTLVELDADVARPAFCSVKVSPGRAADGPSITPTGKGTEQELRKLRLGFHETLGLTCVTYWWHGNNETGIGFTNTSDKVIPKGTVFTFIIQPSGQTGTWTLYYDMEPGETLVVDKLTGVDADQMECDVVVKDKVLAVKPAGDKVP